jgi:hypothetical protein
MRSGSLPQKHFESRKKAFESIEEATRAKDAQRYRPREKFGLPAGGGWKCH